LASRMMRSKVILARSRLGGSADNQRRDACEVATIAASGRSQATITEPQRAACSGNL
jgi:hypothetical protein